MQGVADGIEVILYAWLRFFPTPETLPHHRAGEGDGSSSALGEGGSRSGSGRGAAATVKGFALLPSSKLLWRQPEGADENCPTFCRKRPNSGEGKASRLWGGGTSTAGVLHPDDSRCPYPDEAILSRPEAIPSPPP